MKILKYSLFFMVFCFSCKTKKNMIDANIIAKNISARKVAKKHDLGSFDKKTVDAKLKVNFNNGKTNQGLSVQLKMKKDEVIYLRGTKLITVFKAKITPTSVSYYSPFAKNYFTGDFSMIKQLLGVEINFEQLQNLFLGQALQNLKEDKHEVDIVDNKYFLTPENQNILFDIFYTINPSYFKIDKQSIINSQKNLSLDIIYPSYNLINDIIFPSKINIIAKNTKRTTRIDFDYKTVVFDEDISMSFNIPSGYKRLEF